MKVPATWLQEYLSEPLSAQAMAEALELAGIEIEQVIVSKKLHKNIVIGCVKKVIQHLGADRLKLAEIDSGAGILGVVCGASNLLEGQKVALAQVGTILPDGTEIKAAVIRGQSSAGMICSARELGLGDDHAGIMVFEGDLGVGTKLCDILSNEDILDVKTQANRHDLQSVTGLAREIAAIKKIGFIEPKILPWVGRGPAPDVKNEVPINASRYMAGDLIVGLETLTPDWMRRRLEGAGVRPINIIVDVTNYVMLELGQPLHGFDATKVHLPITIRMAKTNEEMVTLDDIKRKLGPDDLVIADAKGPIAMAGVMGGKRASVTADTRRILLEAASFDGSTIRLMAQRHGLRSEASARFERRLPVQLAPLAIERAADLLIQLADAKASSALTDLLEVWPWVQHIGARSSRLSELFGAKLTRSVIVNSLERLGFEAEKFDIVAEARKHLGKPYIFGASFKTNGTEAFDCSYLVDYIYSKIGIKVGHTALGQFELGQPVHTGELMPGDVVFYEGKIENSATDHYYTTAEDLTHVKHELKATKRVGHNGIYIGNNQVVMAAKYGYENGFWTPMKRAEVVTVPLNVFTENPSYLGARRYADSLDDYVAVTVPWWRTDVKIAEDLLEEVARMVGYNSLAATLPPWQPISIKADSRWPKIWQLKSALRGMNLFEVITYSFVSGAMLEGFGYETSKHLKLRNPLSVEQEYLRSDLLPSLVGAVARNTRYASEFGLYELSRVFKPRSAKELPDEPTHLGVALRRVSDGYKAAKATLDLLAREFQVEFEIKPKDETGFYPGRSAQILIATKVIGQIGEIHPDRLRAAKISGSLGYLEVDFDHLLQRIKEPHYRPVSKFPAISRDLSLVVKDDKTWAEVKGVIDKSDLGRPTFLSEYNGAELPAGYKSIAVRLEMSAMDRTLTDGEADERATKVFISLQKVLGASLRE